MGVLIAQSLGSNRCDATDGYVAPEIASSYCSMIGSVSHLTLIPTEILVILLGMKHQNRSSSESMLELND